MKIYTILVWFLSFILEIIGYLFLVYYFNNEWINGMPIYAIGILFAIVGIEVLSYYELHGTLSQFIKWS